MKKIISVIMAAALLLLPALFAITANAIVPASIVAQVKVTDPRNGTGTLKITLKISNNPGINTLCVNLGYNAKTLAISSITNGNVFDPAHGGSMFDVNQSNNPLIFLFEHEGSENITANGNLAIINFDIIDQFGNFDLSVSVDDENTCAKSNEGGTLHPVSVATTAALSSTVNTQHNYLGLPVTKKATCTEDGSTTKYCNTCGNIISQNIFPATGHDVDYENPEIITDPSCTEPGLAEYYCMNDDCEYSEQKKIPALGHLPGTRTVKKAPTCTENGIYSYTCQRDGCGAVYTENAPALGHDFDNGVVTREATATQKGEKIFTCKREGCGFTKTEEIPALGTPEDTPEEAPKSPKTADDFTVVLAVAAAAVIAGIAVVSVRIHNKKFN